MWDRQQLLMNENEDPTVKCRCAVKLASFPGHLSLDRIHALNRLEKQEKAWDNSYVSEPQVRTGGLDHDVMHSIR